MNFSLIQLYDLVPTRMDWKKHKTIEKGKYVEAVVIWKITQIPVIVELQADNDN